MDVRFGQDFIPSFARPRPKSWLRRFEIFFLTAGLLSLGVYVGAYLYARAYQSFAEYSFEVSLKHLEPTIPGFLAYLMSRAAPADIPSTIPAKRELRYPDSFAAGAVVGRLDIPSIDLSVMLLQGTDHWTLDRGIGHIEGTALPGQTGNVGIAGHRDGFFRGLRKVSKEDLITVTTSVGTFDYRVSKIEIVQPTDVEVLSVTARPTLTLVTCYPFYFVGSAPKRFIVQAELVSP